MKPYTLLLFCYAIISCNISKNNNTPNLVSINEGKVWNVFGVKITGKVLSEDTEGVYSVIITETPAQGGPPLHVHQHEDELFYILKGNYTFTCGDKEYDAPQGSFIKLPKGIPHKFTNNDTITGITMNTITPGGFEHFFDEVAKKSKIQKLNKKEIATIAKSYGVEFIKGK